MKTHQLIDDGPALIVVPIAEAGDGSLVRLGAALDKHSIETVEQFIRMAAIARGVTVFEAAGEFLVEAANFALAVSAARSCTSRANV